MKFKNILIRYGMGFLILWILGTLIPFIWSDLYSSPPLYNMFWVFMVVFNFAGAIIATIFSIVVQPLFRDTLVGFMVMTIGQVLTCWLYKFLLKKLFKIRW